MNSKPEKPGRVVAIGPDVPSLDDVLKEPESAPERPKGVASRTHGKASLDPAVPSVFTIRECIEKFFVFAAPVPYR